jgi:hypothetical protein
MYKMKATIAVKQTGKKGLNLVVLPQAIADMFFHTFCDKSDDKLTIASSEALSNVWPKLVEKFGDVDHITVDDYELTRNVKGESMNFPATATIDNLNMVAIMTGTAKLIEAKRTVAREHAATRELIKQAVKVEVHGYEAGKRGRQAKNVSSENLEAQALAALDL